MRCEYGLWKISFRYRVILKVAIVFLILMLLRGPRSLVVSTLRIGREKRNGCRRRRRRLFLPLPLPLKLCNNINIIINDITLFGRGRPFASSITLFRHGGGRRQPRHATKWERGSGGGWWRLAVVWPWESPAKIVISKSILRDRQANSKGKQPFSVCLSQACWGCQVATRVLVSRQISATCKQCPLLWQIMVLVVIVD